MVHICIDCTENQKTGIMKNLLRFVSILLLITAGINSSITAQPQYYNFNTGTSSNSFPFNVAGGKLVETLFVPGAFSNPTPAPAGTITSIFVRLSTAMVNRVYTDLTIKMAQSTLTSFTTGTFYAGPWTTVYYRSSVTINNPIEWLEFILDTPFAYDPTQSLIVEMGQCGATGSGGSVRNTTTSGIVRVWSVGGCPFVPYNGGDAGTLNFGITLGSTAGPPVVVTTAATGVTSAAATLNGTVNANGDATSVSFEYGLTTSYGTTVPGVPASVSGTTVTPVTAGITGLTPGTTYHYRATGTNTYGTGNGLDMTFTTAPELPSVVTTAATGVTSTTATINGTVNAGGASTSVTFEYGLTTAYGTTVPGVPGTVTGNTITPVSADLTGLSLNTTYHYRVNGVNSVGTSNGGDMTFLTTSCPMPGPPGPVSGPVSVCGNTGGNIYSVAPIVNATGYTWSLPPGAVITAGDNTNTITVTMGNTSGTVSVFGTNTCGNGSTSGLSVTVNAAPEPTLTGHDTLCVNSGYYDYYTQTGFTNYTWTISSGGTITFGQGTAVAQASWSQSGNQWIAVNYTNTNGCSAPVPFTFNVQVDPLPGVAGAINGTANVCGGASGVAYSVAPVSGAMTYVWTLPAGAAIASGAGTNAITVDFDPYASSGNITVYGNSLCGNGTLSPAFAVTVTPFPATAGTISGEASVCQGETGVLYSVPPIANATGYEWTVPYGASIAGGQNTNSITVDFSPSASTGFVTVSGSNSCGSGSVSSLEVVVNSTPPDPVISAMGDSLISSAAEGNQWYKDGIMIQGATHQVYVPDQSGWHWCVVTVNGCSSGESNQIYVVITGFEAPQVSSISLYPVPNEGLFKVSITSPVQETFSIRVFNNTGAVISELQGIEVKGTIEKVIDLRPVSEGIFNVLISSSQTRIVKKVLVLKQ